jgi:hypothetical protein
VIAFQLGGWWRWFDVAKYQPANITDCSPHRNGIDGGGGGYLNRTNPTVSVQHTTPLNDEDSGRNKTAGVSGDICSVPNTKSMKWKYYRALVDVNANIVAVARNVTEDPTHSRDEGSPFIPHRLVFTHKYNIFDCSISAHLMTPPGLFTVAENAKATINAYRQVWSDLEVVFLTDDDCIEVINASEPQLIPYFESLEGELDI